LNNDERIDELQVVLKNAEHGIEVAESDVRKFDAQLSEAQKLNDENVRILMEKNPTWTVGQAMDAVYQSKPHKLTHLQESREKALSALSFFRGKARQTADQIKKLEKAKLEEEAQVSGRAIFEQVTSFVRAYNAAQSAFAELKVLVVAHPATDDLVRRAEMLGFHTCFGITAYTHLSPATLNSLTMDAYAGQVSELTKDGLGSYANIPNELKITYDGLVQTPYPVDTPFEKRTSPLGIQEKPNELLGRAKRRLNEVLNPKRERRSRVVG